MMQMQTLINQKVFKAPGTGDFGKYGYNIPE
jgi:hypothetical protein